MICYWSIEFDSRGGNDGANTDKEPLTDVDEQPQERHITWPEILIISRESVKSQVLGKLDKKPIIDRISENVFFFQQYLISVSNAHIKIYFSFYDFGSKEEMPERKLLNSFYTI